MLELLLLLIALNDGFGPSLLRKFGGWSLCQWFAVFYHQILWVEGAENGKDVEE